MEGKTPPTARALDTIRDVLDELLTWDTETTCKAIDAYQNLVHYYETKDREESVEASTLELIKKTVTVLGKMQNLDSSTFPAGYHQRNRFCAECGQEDCHTQDCRLGEILVEWSDRLDKLENP